tara:strand:+ start:1990 stop:2256 length:267 start_codon:yes stop_codon:yes gene_type:complete
LDAVTFGRYVIQTALVVVPIGPLVPQKKRVVHPIISQLFTDLLYASVINVFDVLGTIAAHVTSLPHVIVLGEPAGLTTHQQQPYVLLA